MYTAATFDELKVKIQEGPNNLRLTPLHPPSGRTFLGRPNKMYFGVVARPEHTEHTGLLTATSQDSVSAAATSMPSSPSSRGRYQGFGHTPAPHSISAPAGFTNSSWEDDGDNTPPSAGDTH